MLSEIQNIANYILNSNEEIPNVVYKRSLYASVCAPIADRPFCAQNYATDLGVRIKPDPKIFFGEMRKKYIPSSILYSNRLDIDAYRKYCESIDFSNKKICHDFDVLINYSGEWESASNIAKIMITEPHLVSDYTLKTYIAEAIGYDNDNKAENVYSMIESTKEYDVVKKTFAKIRHAAYVIKRRKKYSEGVNIIQSGINDINKAEINHEISEDDSLALQGVSNNLLALAYLRLHKNDDALTLIDKACNELYCVKNLVTVGNDERKRYYDQVIINRSQIDVLKGDLKTAYERLCNHQNWVKDNHPDYLCEVLGARGYIEYLMGDYQKSIATLKAAMPLFARNGVVSALNNTRKILSVDYWKIDDLQKSDYFLKSINEDPAGFEYVESMNECEEEKQ